MNTRHFRADEGRCKVVVGVRTDDEHPDHPKKKRRRWERCCCSFFLVHKQETQDMERKKFRRRPTLPKYGVRRGGKTRRSRRQCLTSGLIVFIMTLGGLAMVFRHRSASVVAQATPPRLRKAAQVVTLQPVAAAVTAPVAEERRAPEPPPPPPPPPPQGRKMNEALMPPFGAAPRMDPYGAKKYLNDEPMSIAACQTHARSIPTHAKALDLVRVLPAPEDAPTVLCIAYTYSKKHPAAKTMYTTWMARCDGALVLSDTNETDLAVAVPHDGPEEWKNIWQKTRANWRYVYEYYLEDFDYFIFGGDDYFVIPSNLKRYLASPEIRQANEEGPLYLGRRFKANGQEDKIFNSGGAGYVFNRAALQLLYDNFDQPPCQPKLHGFWEDVMVSQCLRRPIGQVGAKPVEAYDTRDPQGRERFHPFQPGHHLTYRPTPNDWYVKYSVGLKFKEDCCSPETISYHYVKPDLALHMDAILHHCAQQQH